MKPIRYILAFARLDHTLVAGFISVVFLWALVLSASPQLHQRLHPDANRVEHSCAVTTIDPGYHHVFHLPLVSRPFPTIQLPKIPALSPPWAQSPFLVAGIFEHAAAGRCA